MGPPVCVTGANGFLGGHIVEEFLKSGVDVHGTVRDPKSAKSAFLVALGEKYAKQVGCGKLTLFAADLEKEGSFDEAIKGCEVVVHVAASVVGNYKKDPFVEVINPTVNGVINVVGSCNRLGVKRLVYTSSVSTITCADHKRPLTLRGRPFTEDMWNTHYTPTYGTYKYSKIVAEQKLNEIWRGELVSLLPSWVIGPQQNKYITSSQQVVRALVNREYVMVPPLYFDWVDIRDVARAHVYAASSANIASGRYNLSSCTSLRTADLAEAVNTACPEVKAPTRTMPWIVLWIGSWFDKRISSDFLYEKTTRQSPVDNKKIQKAGFEFKHTDLVSSMRDAIMSFREHGITKR